MSAKYILRIFYILHLASALNVNFLCPAASDIIILQAPIYKHSPCFILPMFTVQIKFTEFEVEAQLFSEN